MQELAEVVEARDKKAKVEFKRSAVCKKCGLCCLSESGKMVLEVNNEAQAKTGDKVLVSLSSSASLKASVIVYIIPVVFLIGGYFVGSWLTVFWGGAANQLMGIVFAFVFFGISLWVISLVDKRVQKSREFEPAIVEVIESS